VKSVEAIVLPLLSIQRNKGFQKVRPSSIPSTVNILGSCLPVLKLCCIYLRATILEYNKLIAIILLIAKKHGRKTIQLLVLVQP